MGVYRTDGIILLEKKRFGLLKAPKMKPHKCKLPFTFMRWLFFWLPQIEAYDLWRCSYCHSIYERYDYAHNNEVGWRKLVGYPLERWKELGGNE